MTSPQPGPSNQFLIIRVPDAVRGSAFPEWLTAYGVSALAKRLGVDRTTVQKWKVVGSYQTAPRLSQAWAIIAISRLYPCSIRALTLEDIYGALPEIATQEQPQ